MKPTKLFTAFFRSERAGGMILIFCTIFSLWITNSPYGSQFLQLWDFHLAGHSVVHWINDGLMALFFLLVGLELEREIYVGELSNIKNAYLPLFAAIGGMIFPAMLYLSVNYGTDAQAGAGIPMATDIAFALGILSLLGKRVPTSLKVFLTALAVIDDLGAILIIAMFYTKTIAMNYLLMATGVFVLLIIMNVLKIKKLVFYLIGGVFMWYFMLRSGVHATIAGVLLAFTIPFSKNEKSPSNILEHFLHKPVSFVILPLFALANTAIPLTAGIEKVITYHYSIGIMLGLIIGKPLGILTLCYFAVRLKVSNLPPDLNWKIIIGAGFLAGIGFTMSIFITLLAFDDTEIINNVKLVVLLSSLIAAAIGFTILKRTLKKDALE